MGSRFIECPICGQNIAQHLAHAHAESHFVSAERDNALYDDSMSISNPNPSQNKGTSARSEEAKCVTYGKHGCSRRPDSEDVAVKRQKSNAARLQFKQHSSATETHETRPDELKGHTPRARPAHLSWSFLKSPTEKDIRGPRRTRKAFDLPARPFEFLVVLDFEWTCDNRQRLEPLEIIEFPSVLVRTSFPPTVVSEFQVYCRPERNPVLTKFCKELTAITQEQIDSGVSLPEAMAMHERWLRNALGPLHQVTTPTFAVVTWSDADIMGALDSELRRRQLQRPAHFDRWINLKALFASHYKREPRGGLQRCVESCGLHFEGRAHSGLVDSINTAKICIQMISQGYAFTRTTRGYAPDGEVWGSRRQRALKEESGRKGEGIEAESGGATGDGAERVTGAAKAAR